MINFLILDRLDIYEQLILEEKLLRGTDQNWCLVNRNIQDAAIVLGISGKIEELVCLKTWHQAPISLIRRFTGGGTVIIDQDTVFVTLICNKTEAIPCYQPDSIMKWSGEFYETVFQHPQFALIETDYALAGKKIGGNAQYIQKNRWLHHTSFLWNYKEENMQYLKQPVKMPEYRQNRNHLDFITPICNYISCYNIWIKQLQETLKSKFNEVEIVSAEQAMEITSSIQTRIGTKKISLDSSSREFGVFSA